MTQLPAPCHSERSEESVPLYPKTWVNKILRCAQNDTRCRATIAQANLAKMEAGARPEQIAQAQSALNSAQISYTNAKNNYDRNQQLLTAGVIPQAQFETTQTQLAAAQAQFDSAQEQLKMLSQGETQESLNVLRSQVTQSQAALELAKTQLAKNPAQGEGLNGAEAKAATILE